MVTNHSFKETNGHQSLIHKMATMMVSNIRIGFKLEQLHPRIQATLLLLVPHLLNNVIAMSIAKLEPLTQSGLKTPILLKHTIRLSAW